MRDGWVAATLGQVADTVRDTVKASSVELPYFGLEHFDPGSPRLVRHGASRDMESAATRVSPGDVLFSKLRPYLNKVAVSPAEATCTTEVLAWRRRDGTELRQDFLALLLRDDAAIAYANHSAGGTRMPRTSAKAMATYPVLLPPLGEQQRIVDLIAAVDDAIDAAEAEARSATKTFLELRTLLVAAPTIRRRFKDIAQLQRGFDLPTTERTAGDVVVISAGGEHGSHFESPVPFPGVVTGRSGTVGEVFYVDRAFWPLNTTLWVKDFKGNEPKYIRYVLQTLDLESRAGGTTVKSLNRNVLDDIPVHCPEVEVQRLIVALLESAEDSASGIGQVSAKLRVLRTNLLTALLSGEHEIPSSYDRFLEKAA